MWTLTSAFCKLLSIISISQSLNQLHEVNLYSAYYKAWTKALTIQGGPKQLAHFLYALTLYAFTSSSIDRFSNLFHSLNQWNICNNIITENPTTPQVYCYTLWHVIVLKSNNWNIMTSVITHFKKLTTGNHVKIFYYHIENRSVFDEV